MVKHGCLPLLLNAARGTSGWAQPRPTLGGTLSHRVDAVYSQWGRMGQDLALCLSVSNNPWACKQ